MVALRLITTDRIERRSKPNPLAVAKDGLVAAVAAFNTDRLPGAASEDDVRQIAQQLRAILHSAAELVEKAANEVDGSVPGSTLNPPLMAAILRDIAKDEILDPIEAVAELARIVAEDPDTPERDLTFLDAAE